MDWLYNCQTSAKMGGLRMIEIYLLEQLATFEECKTLSKAAEKLLVSQPALSRSMQKLEDKIGVRLFERSKNRIFLNKYGKLAASYARQIINKENEMIEHVRFLEYSNHTITFGSASPGPNMYYPRILSKIYPDKEIVTELQDENLLLDGLNKGNFQFIFLPHKIYSEDLFCTEAVCEHLYLSVVSGHPASSLKEVSFKDMDGEPFLMYTHVGFWEGIVRENMPASRFLLQYEYNDFEEIVKNTSLPSFASSLFTDKAVPGMDSRRTVPFSDKSAFATYYFICKNSSKRRYREFIASL